MAACISTIGLDVTAHLEWAAAIARRVAKAYRFQPCSQEEEDLISVAHLAIVRKAATYDPGREVVHTDCGALFRGYCSQTVSTECRREARRIRNGGTYNTRAETPGEALIVTAFSAMPTRSADESRYEPAGDFRPY